MPPGSHSPPRGFRGNPLPIPNMRTKNGPVTYTGFEATWTHRDGDRYLTCGKLCNGKRFRVTDSNPLVALSRNLWDGRTYLVRDGRRYMLRRVTP